MRLKGRQKLDHMETGRSKQGIRIWFEVHWKTHGEKRNLTYIL